MVDGSSMNGFPLVIADSEQDMPGIETGRLSIIDHFAEVTFFSEPIKIFESSLVVQIFPTLLKPV